MHLPPTPAPAGPQRAGAVADAIRQASAATGTSFDYLLKTAQRESNFDPARTVRTSSATGLFQFTEGTWLATLKADGARFGYGDLAAHIRKTPSGRHEVDDPAMKRTILALRTDPVASSLMAGAFSARNAGQLTAALGRRPSEGELYMAHFLGAGGATRFLESARTAPHARADAAFPEAAQANRSIFYARDGRARSFAEVAAVLTSQHAPSSPQPAPSAPLVAQAFAPEPERMPAPVAFHDLFTTAPRGPVADGVAALWTARGTARPGAIGTPIDLARFLRPGVIA